MGGEEKFGWEEFFQVGGMSKFQSDGGGLPHELPSISPVGKTLQYLIQFDALEKKSNGTAT